MIWMQQLKVPLNQKLGGLIFSVVAIGKVITSRHVSDHGAYFDEAKLINACSILLNLDTMVHGSSQPSRGELAVTESGFLKVQDFRRPFNIDYTYHSLSLSLCLSIKFNFYDHKMGKKWLYKKWNCQGLKAEVRESPVLVNIG